ncbi:MAG TPA: restriction endonuclease subunit S [Methylococcaceae bacterium]|nr:restriction endonuclease subunit S [Methylococcaceae bacterium]
MARTQLKDVCEVSWGDTTVTKASYVAVGYPAFSASGCDGFLPYFDHEGPGIVLSAIGAQCGKTWFTQGKWSCIKNTIYIKSKSSEADARYIFYTLSDPDVWPKRGAAQPFISQTDARNVEVPLPPLPVQQRIAGILSAYDELIENSQRRIKILESMARALYREWFVHFRFPGHEHHPRVTSPLGEIPQGWKVKMLGSIADISWGDTSTTKASYVEDGYAAYSASGMDGRLDHFDYDRVGIVLSAIGAQCGKTWLARGQWSCIKNTIRFWASSDTVSTEFLFIATEGQDFWPRRGAAQPFISQGDAQRKEILIPDDLTMKNFSAFVADALKQVSVLESQIQNLRRARDLLLPRLLSGQIEVEAA